MREIWDEQAYYDWETDTYIPGWIESGESFVCAMGAICQEDAWEFPGDENRAEGGQHYYVDFWDEGSGTVTVSGFNTGTVTKSILSCPQELHITLHGGSVDGMEFDLTACNFGFGPPAALAEDGGGNRDGWRHVDPGDPTNTLTTLWPLYKTSPSGYYYTDWELIGFRLDLPPTHAPAARLVICADDGCPKLGTQSVLTHGSIEYTYQTTITATVEASI